MSLMSRSVRRILLFVACLLFLPSSASAQTIIKRDEAHNYALEIDLHGVLTPFGAPQGSSDVGIGAGAMFGINLAPRGFLPSVNDSVALGVGFDFVHYSGGSAVASECVEWVGSGASRICVRTRRSGGGGNYFYVPAVMQWNFYINKQFSLFGEPGLAAYLWNSSFDRSLNFGMTPVFNVGGRWHFSEAATLTFRVGYPYTTIGVSFFL